MPRARRVQRRIGSTTATRAGSETARSKLVGYRFNFAVDKKMQVLLAKIAAVASGSLEPWRGCESLSARLSSPACRDYAASLQRSDVHNDQPANLTMRHAQVMSDPSNLFIPRCVNAGRVTVSNKERYVVMHNGLQVVQRGYFGSFAQIFETNLGVHEAAEERIFGEVVARMPPGAVMMELGSYWAFYSTWFGRAIDRARVFCVEASKKFMAVGQKNMARNGVSAEFINAFVGNEFNVSSFVAERSLDVVDLLHVDIQGHEKELLEDIRPLLKARRVRVLFISTHSQLLHRTCRAQILAAGYRLSAELDCFAQTFFVDGLLVASAPGVDYPAKVDLGSRMHTPLRMSPYEGLQTGEPCRYGQHRDAKERTVTNSNSIEPHFLYILSNSRLVPARVPLGRCAPVPVSLGHRLREPPQ